MENNQTENTNSNSPENNFQEDTTFVLPKPLLEEDKQNWVRKSLISLGIYALFFYFVFDRNITYIAAVLVVLMIHEMGHFFAMKYFNYSNVKLFVLPLLGAYVTGKKNLISQRQMSIVILAGPVPGIIIGFSMLMYNINFPNERIEMLGQIFLFLNVFNLLPFIPLDGGRLLETLFLNRNHTIKIVFTVISILILIALGIKTGSFFFLIIPVSMIFDIIMEIKNQKIRKYLDQEQLNYTIDYSNLPNKDYWIIRDCVLLSFPKRYSMIEAGIQSYSPMEGGIIQHVISILKTPFIKDVKALEKIAIILSYLLFLVVLPLIYAFFK